MRLILTCTLAAGLLLAARLPAQEPTDQEAEEKEPVRATFLITGLH